MFIVNQDSTSCFNIDIIDQITAVNPRNDDEDKRPLVIALIGSREEVLGRYATMDDCRITVDYLSFLINKGTSKICVPGSGQIKAIRGDAIKAMSIQGNGGNPLDVNALAQSILHGILSDNGKTNIGGTSK